MSVPARISIVTLGVDDVARSKAFYEALGWEVAGSVGDEICWFRTSGLVSGPVRPRIAREGCRAPLGADRGVRWHHPRDQRRKRGGRDEAFEAATGAGGRILKPAERTDWGGYSGYFADPDGHPWEVAYNPSFPIGDDGRITIS